MLNILDNRPDDLSHSNIMKYELMIEQNLYWS